MLPQTSQKGLGSSDLIVKNSLFFTSLSSAPRCHCSKFHSNPSRNLTINHALLILWGWQEELKKRRKNVGESMHRL